MQRGGRTTRPATEQYEEREKKKQFAVFVHVPPQPPPSISSAARNVVWLAMRLLQQKSIHSTHCQRSKKILGVKAIKLSPLYLLYKPMTLPWGGGHKFASVALSHMPILFELIQGALKKYSWPFFWSYEAHHKKTIKGQIVYCFWHFFCTSKAESYQHINKTRNHFLEKWRCCSIPSPPTTSLPTVARHFVHSKPLMWRDRVITVFEE